MARRHAADAPFRRDRIREGLAGGAVVEVDLQAAADGFVVLHDERLDGETTGTGPVASTPLRALARVRLRGDGGEAPLSLDALADLVAATPERGGHLQIDLKIDALSDAGRESVAAALAPIAPRIVLSAYDAGLVARLASALPGTGQGFDPLELAGATPPGDWTAFVARTLEVGARARWIYLHAGLIEAAARDGVDLVAPLRASGRRVDAWTVDGSDDDDAWPERVAALVAAGVDQITTNTPDLLAHRLEAA